MAGLNLLLKTTKGLEKLTTISEFIPHLLKHQIIWNNDGFILSSHNHDGYPNYFYSNSSYSVFLEGRVYNLNEEELKRELDSLFNQLQEKTINKSEISNILFKMDGDYIIVFHDKKKQKIHLINDIYGRLPLYFGENNGLFMISRNPDVISKTIDLKEIDNYGVAEYLTFGYMVTQKTLIHGLKYFLPGNYFSFNLNNKSFDILDIFTYNFEKLISVSAKTYKEKLKLSVEYFKIAIKQRAGSQPMLGLSGGMDSRIIASVLSESPLSKFTSRLSFNFREQKDVDIAKEISNLLGVNLDVLEVEQPTLAISDELIKLKLGLNSLENDYNLMYEKKLVNIYGNQITYFTGDGGDRLKPHIRFNKAKDLKSFVNEVIKINSRFELNSICDLVGIEKEVFNENIRKYFESFPEQSYGYKYVHFWVYNRGFRYVLEGEDRKRNFFWTATPFYSHQFFHAIMSFPDQNKRDYALFIDFVEYLNPGLNKIKNKNWNLNPTNWRLKIYLKAQRYSKYLKKILNFFYYNKTYTNHNLKLLEDIKFSHEISDSIQNFIKSKMDSRKLSRSEILLLLTPDLVKVYLKRKNN